jgi:hypothetical protein
MAFLRPETGILAKKQAKRAFFSAKFILKHRGGEFNVIVLSDS